MSRISFVVASVFTLILPCIAAGQDWLPPVPTGTVQVQYQTFATGLPVAGDFNTGGPTDLVTIPNGTQNLAVTNFGGQVHPIRLDGKQICR